MATESARRGGATRDGNERNRDGLGTSYRDGEIRFVAVPAHEQDDKVFGLIDITTDRRVLGKEGPVLILNSDEYFSRVESLRPLLDGVVEGFEPRSMDAADREGWPRASWSSDSASP